MQGIREALVSTEEERRNSLLVVLGDFNAKFLGECSSKVTDAHGEELNKLSLALGLRRLASPGATTQYGSALDHCMVPWGGATRPGNGLDATAPISTTSQWSAPFGVGHRQCARQRAGAGRRTASQGSGKR